VAGVSTRARRGAAAARRRAGERPGASLVGTELELDIGAVAHGGMCVARADGRVVFVRHALPGERVRARVTEGREPDRFLRADAVEILQASPDRVQPPCPYAGPGRCGGCDWQHATPEAQRRLKADVLAEQLRRLAGRDLVPAVEAVPGEPDGSGWRTRVRFAVDAAGRPGLRRHRSHDVVPLTRCHIAHPGVVATGALSARWTGMDEIGVTAAGDGSRVVLAHPAAPVRSAPGKPAAAGPPPGGGAAEGRAAEGRPADAPRAAKRPPEPVVPRLAPGVMVAVAGRGPQPGPVRESAAGHIFAVPASGFWQAHPAAADVLVGAVLEGLAPAPGEAALDLYCGSGLFAAALADRVGVTGRVVAVEGDPAAAAAATRNLAGTSWVRVVPGGVERALASGLGAIDLVVLDPPRAGAGRPVVEAIAALRPRQVAYVACDPAALARDLGLFAGLGYSVAGLRAFDLFPHTHHVEAVAFLARTES
jgi:tRNA/tmRNA/rRNA uracil-C5-methylase (TrmA/RlmC/RlmD family)